MEALIVFVLLVGIPLYFIMEYGSILLSIAIGFVALIIFVLIADAIATESQLKGIQYTLVVGRTNWMNTKTRPSGFSIGSRGSIRGYWRFREEVDHVEVKFEVHYEDGRVRMVTANEGTSKCDRLMSFVGSPPNRKENVPTQKAIEPQLTQTTTIQVARLEKVERKQDAITDLTQSQIAQKKKDEKRFAEVPFEVTPNEFNLAVHNPSCQMVKRSDGEYRIFIRFAITYNPSVKGVRNRCVKCATIDSAGRMTAVERECKVLDLSGSRLVEITFLENAEQEPAKVIVGLDRYT